MPRSTPMMATASSVSSQWPACRTMFPFALLTSSVGGPDPAVNGRTDGPWLATADATSRSPYRLVDLPAMAHTREDAWNTLNEFTKAPHLVKHGLGVETAMRAYAPRYGGDAET